MHYLVVFIGGGIGSMLRYSLSVKYSQLHTHLPIPTLIANVASSVILGALMGYMAKKNIDSLNLKLLLATGFCGGFSTFSTFSLETVQLFLKSDYKFAIANIGLNFVLSLLALITGLFLFQK